MRICGHRRVVRRRGFEGDKRFISTPPLLSSIIHDSTASGRRIGVNKCLIVDKNKANIASATCARSCPRRARQRSQHKSSCSSTRVDPKRDYCTSCTPRDNLSKAVQQQPPALPVSVSANERHGCACRLAPKAASRRRRPRSRTNAVAASRHGHRAGPAVPGPGPSIPEELRRARGHERGPSARALGVAGAAAACRGRTGWPSGASPRQPGPQRRPRCAPGGATTMADRLSIV